MVAREGGRCIPKAGMPEAPHPVCLHEHEYEHPHSTSKNRYNIFQNPGLHNKMPLPAGGPVRAGIRGSGLARKLPAGGGRPALCFGSLLTLFDLKVVEALVNRLR